MGGNISVTICRKGDDNEEERDSEEDSGIGDQTEDVEGDHDMDHLAVETDGIAVAICRNSVNPLDELEVHDTNVARNSRLEMPDSGSDSAEEDNHLDEDDGLLTVGGASMMIIRNSPMPVPKDVQNQTNVARNSRLTEPLSEFSDSDSDSEPIELVLNVEDTQVNSSNPFTRHTPRYISLRL